MAILPSDHFIRNRDLFHYLLRAAFEVARENYLVTLGITPTFPSSAYGYIQQGEPLRGEFQYPVYKVRSFKEKPDEQTAQAFLRARDHSWNSGMFIWRTDIILREIQRQMPALGVTLEKISTAWGTPSLEEVLKANWPNVKIETIDYGVMERAEKVVVLPAGGLGWNDVGSWDTLFDVLFPDMDGNVSMAAQHLALDTHNTLVYGNSSDHLIVTIGMDDTVIVDSGDVLLVCKSDQAQKVRDVVDHLKKHRQENYL
jgi:mannose-1-phosphate guanylyltransferase